MQSNQLTVAEANRKAKDRERNAIWYSIPENRQKAIERSRARLSTEYGKRKHAAYSRKYERTENGILNRKKNNKKWNGTPEAKEYGRAYQSKRRKNPTINEQDKAKYKAWSKTKEGAITRRLANARRRAIKKGSELGDQRAIKKWADRMRARRRVFCYWCNTVVKSNGVHIDHINPLKSGGNHSMENLCISCPACNLRKGAKSVEQWNHVISEPILI